MSITIKTFILFLIILPIVISLLVYVIIKGGKYFYIFTEICAIILMFIFMWVYPNIIQPLFNKFKELEEGDLKTGIMDLAKRVNYPLKKIYEMDASQRSSHSNAYLFGFWKNKRIVLFDTLIKNLENKEIEGVLGHEFGHWAKWHSIILLFISFTNIFIIFYLLQFFINEIPIFISFGFEQKSVFIGLYLFFLIYSPVTFFINAIQNYIVRIIEYQADKYSYELGYGDYLKKALIKLSESNKSDLDPDTTVNTTKVDVNFFNKKQQAHLKVEKKKEKKSIMINSYSTIGIKSTKSEKNNVLNSNKGKRISNKKRMTKKLEKVKSGKKWDKFEKPKEKDKDKLYKRKSTSYSISAFQKWD